VKNEIQGEKSGIFPGSAGNENTKQKVISEAGKSLVSSHLGFNTCKLTVIIFGPARDSIA